MNQHMYKKKILVPVIWLPILLISPALGNQNHFDVSPKVIDLGETVTIRIDKTVDIYTHRILILSPSGKVYSPVPEKKLDHYEISFSETHERGFLNDNWNQYKVSLVDGYNKAVESSCFYIKPKRKQLFFTVYVDDIGGAGFLNKAGEKWFKGLGGKINYGYENDDWGRQIGSLESVISKYGGDYIFHHYHAVAFNKNRLFLKINRLLRWKHIKESINGFFRVKFRDRHYILGAILLQVLSVALGLYKKAKVIRSILILNFLFTLVVLSAVLSSQFVLNQNNWSLKFSDAGWCEAFLLQTKREFEHNNLTYPPVIRHGFNIPPRKLNGFYLSQMGVLADSSFIFPDGLRLKDNNSASVVAEGTYETDDRLILKQLGKYSYNWPEKLPLPLPYYSDLRGELNTLYEGVEAHRGLLEMPLTFGNICANGLYEPNYEIIDYLPGGALVSTYIHPGDNLYYLNQVISYLQEKYDLTFISALDYLKIYLNYFPRPILVDAKRQKIFWAYLEDSRLMPIIESDSIVLENDNLIIRNLNLPPYIGLSTDTVFLGELAKRYTLVGDAGKNQEDIYLYKLRE